MTRNRLGIFAASLAGLLLAPAIPAPAAAAPGPAPLRIMPLGDSITVGVGSPGKNGWRADLQSRLRDAGVRTDFVGSQREGTTGDRDHEGHGGWTIERLAGIVDESLAAAKPDVVLLHAGTNNITRADNPLAAARKLSDLIDQIRTGAPRAEIYVATIVGTTVASEVAANQAYNTLIPAIVAQKDAQVHLVDQSTVAGLDIYDRHHPNEFGYRKMAHNWYQAMRRTTHPQWPTTVNPYRARKANLCHARSRTQRECRTWNLRRVIVSRTDGRTVTENRWQTTRTFHEQVRTWVPGHHKKRTWVPGRYETQTRKVNRWSDF